MMDSSIRVKDWKEIILGLYVRVQQLVLRNRYPSSAECPIPPPLEYFLLYCFWDHRESKQRHALFFPIILQISPK